MAAREVFLESIESGIKCNVIIFSKLFKEEEGYLLFMPSVPGIGFTLKQARAYPHNSYTGFAGSLSVPEIGFSWIEV